MCSTQSAQIEQKGDPNVAPFASFYVKVLRARSKERKRRLSGAMNAVVILIMSEESLSVQTLIPSNILRWFSGVDEAKIRATA